MPLDKLRGLYRLSSGSTNTVSFLRISSGSAAETWTENNKNHYKFNSAATIDLKIVNQTYYTKRDRNGKKTIGNVTSNNNNIDFVIAAGGGGGGQGYNPYGGGGGGGGGGFKGFHPAIPAPQKAPAALSLAAPINGIVGGIPEISINPFTDPAINPVPMPISIGAGGGNNADGAPSSIDLPSNYRTLVSSPTLGAMSATYGGGGTYQGNGRSGASGAGGASWVSGSGGPTTDPTQGSAGGPGSGTSQSGGGGGGGGGKTGAGTPGAGTGGNGGAGLSIPFTPGSVTYGGGGAGAGRPAFATAGPPHGAPTPYSGAGQGTAGAGGGPAPGGTGGVGGGGGGGYGNGSGGGTGGNGQVIVSFI